MIGCRILASWTTLKSVAEIRNPDMLIGYPQNMVRYVDLKELIRFLWNVPEICPVGWRTMKAAAVIAQLDLPSQISKHSTAEK